MFHVKLLSNIFIITIILITFNCKCTKSNSSEDKVASAAETMDKRLIQEGYRLGTIEYNPESNCPYKLTDEENSITYDPINFSDEKFKAFYNKNSKVYFKYRGLRRPNRCLNMLPIHIIEIQKR